MTSRTKRLAAAVAALLCACLAPVLGAPAAAESAGSPNPREARRDACLGWMHAGYPSGIDEKSCRSEFALPSAFLFACARGLERGFRDGTDRDACALYFAAESVRMRNGYVRD